jgi:hypothetical protein
LRGNSLSAAADFTKRAGAFVEAVSSLGLYWVLLNRPPPLHAA